MSDADARVYALLVEFFGSNLRGSQQSLYHRLTSIVIEAELRTEAAEKRVEELEAKLAYSPGDLKQLSEAWERRNISSEEYVAALRAEVRRSWDLYSEIERLRESEKAASDCYAEAEAELVKAQAEVERLRIEVQRSEGFSQDHAERMDKAEAEVANLQAEEVACGHYQKWKEAQEKIRALESLIIRLGSSEMQSEVRRIRAQHEENK